MKKRKFHPLLLLLGLLMLLCTGMPASAAVPETVLINGVEYRLSPERSVATAYIDNVRGDNLPTELYIPRKVKYQDVKYKVTDFCWNGPEDPYAPRRYLDWEIGSESPLNDDDVWRQNVVIPDKSRSYHACLKKITFAKGVKVYGQAYNFEELRRVVFEDPQDMESALYYNCPKLKRLHLPEKLKYRSTYDIKNCPSLKLTIDKKNKHLKMVGNDIVSKHKALMNVLPKKKYYKVPKGIKGINVTAFWGDTSIEKVHTGKNPIRVEGLPNLKRIKVDRKGSKYDTFYWNDVAYCPSLRRVDLPESIRYIYKERLSPDHWRETLATVKHVYLYSKTLKGGDLSEIPEETTFHARNKKVANKLRKFGFKGSIVIEKNMK